MTDENNNRKFGSFGASSDTGTKFQGYRVERSYSLGTPKIIQLVMNYSGGFIKNEKQASYILVGLAVLVIIISIFLFFHAASVNLTKQNPLIHPSN